MTAKNNNETHYPKFWFGFAVGAAACGVAAYMMGTKKGRDTIKKTMKYMEKLEENPDTINSLTDLMQAFTQTMANPDTTTEAPVERPVASKKPSAPPDEVKDVSSLNSIIDRMRNITSDKKTENKFFIKPNKK